MKWKEIERAPGMSSRMRLSADRTYSLSLVTSRGSVTEVPDAHAWIPTTAGSVERRYISKNVTSPLRDQAST